MSAWCVELEELVLEGVSIERGENRRSSLRTSVARTQGHRERNKSSVNLFHRHLPIRSCGESGRTAFCTMAQPQQYATAVRRAYPWEENRRAGDRCCRTCDHPPSPTHLL